MRRTAARALREDRAHHRRLRFGDRKSTRLNSSHLVISYAVFCLKKKKRCFATSVSPQDHTLIEQPPLHWVQPLPLFTLRRSFQTHFMPPCPGPTDCLPVR